MMQTIQANLCDFPLSVVLVDRMSDFRNGHADMGLLEIVARRTAMEFVILLTLPCLAIETAIRLPFGLIAWVFSVTLPQDDSWKEEREFCQTVFATSATAVFCMVVLPAAAVMNIYQQTTKF